MKRWIVNLLRWGAPAAIVGYLVDQARRDDSFALLWEGEKNWGLLLVSAGVYFAAQLLTIVRWHWLVRALDLPFRFADALRLGFLGYLLTFVSLGAVGGDLFKAIFVAREQPRRRAEAVASVIVDRILGLYSLFVLAAGTILAAGLWRAPQSEKLRILSQVVLACTVAATVGIAMLMAIGGSRGRRTIECLGNLPLAGKLLKPLAGALQTYRRKGSVVAASIGMGIVVQALLAGSIYAIAAAVLPAHPGLVDHLIVVPLAMLTAVLPLPVNGLGAFELVVEFLYQQLSPGLPKGYGLIVSLAFRLVSIAVTGLCAAAFVKGRKDLEEALRETEEEAARLEGPPGRQGPRVAADGEASEAGLSAESLAAGGILPEGVAEAISRQSPQR